jgi:hypothetical protein
MSAEEKTDSDALVVFLSYKRPIARQYLQTDQGSLHTYLYLCIMHHHSQPYSKLITNAPFNYLNQPSCRSVDRSYGLPHSVRLVVTDVTRQPTDPIFLDCLTLEEGINRLFRNVGNYQSTLRDIPEER